MIHAFKKYATHSDHREVEMSGKQMLYSLCCARENMQELDQLRELNLILQAKQTYVTLM